MFPDDEWLFVDLHPPLADGLIATGQAREGGAAASAWLIR